MPKALWFVFGFIFALMLGVALIVSPLAGTWAGVIPSEQPAPPAYTTPVPEPVSQMPAKAVGLRWSRQGLAVQGADACSRLEIDQDRQVHWGPCSQGTRMAHLTLDELGVYAAYLTHLAPFEYAVQQAGDVHSTATVLLTFAGQGSRQATLSEQAELAEWVHSVYNRVMGEERRANLLAQARLDLARRKSISIDRMEVLAVEEVTWPDSCLGLRETGVFCAQVPTRGYLLTLGLDGEAFSYRTDLYTSVRAVEGYPAHMVMPPIDPH